VERQVAHLTRLVDDLLDAARIARGRIRLHRMPVELGGLVLGTVEDHRPTFDDAGIALETHLPPEPCWVDVDATRIAQVLGNLLGNAAKFTAPGGRVEITLRRERDAAAVTIRDTGVGIAPEVRERLFEPFAQAPQTLDRTLGGLGLGLATVKGLVELHGGTVALSSGGTGCGAEFTVRLPPTAAPAARGREVARSTAPRALRVLVIDDNQDAASTLQQVLALAGHEARIAFDGARGVALARAFAPDVVLCDIGLPGMDGYAVARALRGDPVTRDARLLALTGYARPDDLRRAAEAGFDRHLSKPLGIDALVQALEEPQARRAASDLQPSPGM
jgi:two-component system CheB/CheR fusion protein